MNPFSAFLQPPTQRSPLAGAGEFVRGLQQDKLEKQKFSHLQQENALDNARSDAFLKIQQTDQARRLSDADKKEQEALLAEYLEARSSGNPGRIQEAEQMLKRFGMDVSQGGMDPRAAAFTGAQALPGMLPMAPGQGNAFTGTAPEESPDLSQEAFEAQLIEGSGKLPERMEQGGETTQEFKSQLPQDEVIDLDAEDPTPLQLGGLPKVSAGTKDFPVPEGSVDGGDLDAVEQTSQAHQAASQMAPALPGGLPVRISKGGKQLYESTGPSGRWAPMVQGVFQAAAQHQDPEFAAAGKRAQEMATKLIGVDGIAPKDAIKFAASQLENEIQNITNFRRTELGTRPKYGGGGGVATAATIKGRKPFNDEMNRTYMQFKSEKLDEQYQGYNAGIGAISSANTASQYDALNRLIQARSGLTVSDKERAIYNNLAGMWQGWLKQFNLLSGGDLPDEYRAQLKALMNEARSAVVEEKQRRAQTAANFYRAKVRGTADPAEIEMDANELANAIMVGASAGTAQGGGGDPNADLYQ